MNAKQLDETPPPRFEPLTEQRDTAQPETHAQFCEREMLRLNNEKIEVEAHAERLAEACKAVSDSINGNEYARELARNKAREALAAWEGAQK